MGDSFDNYSKQVYFDLSSNTYQMRQLKDWDLCFESSPDGFGVFTNSGAFVTIRKSNLIHLSEPQTHDTNTIIQFPELREGSDGKATSSAIGDWRMATKVFGNDTQSPVYYIKLNHQTGKDRYRKMQLLGFNDSFYLIKICKLDEDRPAATILIKNKACNYTYYSFKNGGSPVENIEPPKSTWDFVFTRYHCMLHNTSIYYPVTGVLNNPDKVMVATDFTSKFYDIHAGSINNYTFSSNRDVIGYDNWKTIDNFSASAVFTVHPDCIYIIKDTDGHYYKLRFLDFYDKFRKTGHPKFEYVKIK